MKYKVGDKVRIRQDLQVGRRYGGVTARKGMKENFGAVGTIELIHNNAYRLSVSGFWWSEEMFEKVDAIDIVIDGKETRAKYGNKVGVAKCSPDDEFDIFVGAKLALERLEKQCKPYAWLQDGCKYWIPAFDSATLCKYETFIGSEYNKMMLERGVVFKTREEAIAAAKKMLAALIELKERREKDG